MKIAKLMLLLVISILMIALASCDAEKPVNTDSSVEETTVSQSDTTFEETTVVETEAVTQTETFEETTADLPEETTAEPHYHSYSPATCEKPGVCECGTIYGDPLGHDFTDATCTTPKVCNRCGVAEGTALNHDYISATCTNPKTCSRCKMESGEAQGHDFRDATCTSAEICKRCEATQGLPLGHDYEAATCTKPEICRVCGYEHGEAMGHTYVDNYCIRCNEVDPESLPVGLEKLHFMGYTSSISNEYRLKYSFESELVDTFGNKQSQAHAYLFTNYGYVGNTKKSDWIGSEHALSKKYSTFIGTIVARDGTSSQRTFKIEIFVDGELKYSYDNYKTTTGAVDFEIDVTGGAVLKIVVTRDFTEDNSGIALVNTQLYK